MKLNNKGQVFAVFIILIPVLLMLFTFVVDLGLLAIEKRSISNAIEDSLEYGLNNINDSLIENNIRDLLIENIDDISQENIKIIIQEKTIKITILKDYKTIFNIIGKDKYNIEITYTGSIVNGKKRINKE